jgi:hypothetical protein
MRSCERKICRERCRSLLLETWRRSGRRVFERAAKWQPCNIHSLTMTEIYDVREFRCTANGGDLSQMTVASLLSAHKDMDLVRGSGDYFHITAF